ncbi:MAG: hypothetical protein RLY43_606 [Bacteroidota bacterium]|jgi:hypothetical protein
MAKHTELKYRTYDQLLAEVQTDMRSFYLEDLINPQEFIKVAKKVNYELGLKLFKTKEDVIEIERGKAKLPNDFNVLNFALLVSQHKVTEPVIQGIQTEYIPAGVPYTPPPGEIAVCATPVVNPQSNLCGTCNQSPQLCNCTQQCSVTLNCQGQSMMLVQKLKYETRTWSEFHPVRITDTGNVLDLDCPNKTWMSRNSAYIRNGFIHTSFPTGKMYINYQGMMEDDEGNLLVPDHDMLNEYYEYAIKQRVLENAILNGETVTQMQFQVVEQRLRAARNNANSLVNTPDFGELRKIWETNRRAQYSNYWNMFKRY